MLVSLVVRRLAQRGWRIGEEEAGFFSVGVEDSEFFVVIGRTALKARNCFAAASELCNKCLERDSRSREACVMAGH